MLSDKLIKVISANPPGAKASQITRNGSPVALSRKTAIMAAKPTINAVEATAAVKTRYTCVNAMPANRAPTIVPITSWEIFKISTGGLACVSPMA